MTCRRTEQPPLPPKYEEAIRQRNIIPPPPDIPPDYWESIRQRPAPSTFNNNPIEENDEFNDAACLCAILCLGLKILSIFGR